MALLSDTVSIVAIDEKSLLPRSCSAVTNLVWTEFCNPIVLLMRLSLLGSPQHSLIGLRKPITDGVQDLLGPFYRLLIGLMPD